MAQLQLSRVLLLLPAGHLRVLSGWLEPDLLVERLVKAGGEAVFPENASCMSLRAVMATTGSCAWA